MTIEIIDFYATWCGPCKMIAPVLDKLEAETGVPVRKIDVEKEPELAARFGVSSVPTIIKTIDGLEANRVLGAKPLTVLKRELHLD